MLDRPPPPLNFVRSFECSARHLSFTRAAEELGYTQAAISVHIRALEQYLGAKLFHRRPRSLELTEIGQAFLPTLRQALRMIDLATETVVIGSQHRTITISCPMSLASNWLPARLVGFHMAHPSVEIVVHGTVWEAMSVAHAQLVVSMHRDVDAPSGAVRLLRERLVLLATPEVATDIETLNDLAVHPRIVVLGRQEFWSAFDDLPEPDGQDLRMPIRTNATNIALEFAAAGAGVVAAPLGLAQPYLDRGALAPLLDRQARSPWSYFLTIADGPPNETIHALRDWLVADGGRAGVRSSRP